MLGDGDPSFPANQTKVELGQVNNEPASPKSQEASIESPSGIGSSTPFPFDFQSSLENEDGSHGTYRNTVESMSRS